MLQFEPVTEKPLQSKPFRNACVTIFFETSPCPEWESLKKQLKYFAYGLEHTENGKPHYQAYAIAWKPMRSGQWIKLFKPHHVERMYGTVEESDGYCQKEGRLTEFGVKPNLSGVTNKLLEFKRKLDEGENVMDIAEEEDHFHTYLRYRGGLHEYKRHKLQKQAEQNGFRKPDVFVRIGPPRTGKTRWVFDTYGVGNVTVISGTMLRRGWFPPYVRDVVLFDDVEANSIMQLPDFKNYTDGYPRTGECKGDYVCWHPKVIVFTSNSHPFTWWKDLTDFDKKAIEERITEVVVVE